MTAQAFALILCAALLHAAWNLMVKSSSDRLASVWAVVTAGAVMNIPVLVVLGLPDQRVAGWIILSAVLHVGYGYALAGAYDRIDLAAAYPVARGTAPPLVTIFGIWFLGDAISAVGIAGIALVTISLGIIGLRHVQRGVSWAVLTGFAIAAYTLSDGAGVRAGDEAIRYIGALFVLHAALFTIVLGITRRSFSSLGVAIRRSPGRLMFGGFASAGAYLLVMIAARSTPLGLVAGLRESSAGFAVLAGFFLLNEKVSGRHALGVMGMIGGSVLIALS